MKEKFCAVSILSLQGLTHANHVKKTEQKQSTVLQLKWTLSHDFNCNLLLKAKLTPQSITRNCPIHILTFEVKHLHQSTAAGGLADFHERIFAVIHLTEHSKLLETISHHDHGTRLHKATQAQKSSRVLGQSSANCCLADRGAMGKMQKDKCAISLAPLGCCLP